MKKIREINRYGAGANWPINGLSNGGRYKKRLVFAIVFDIAGVC
jgi:hypothetical protein